MPNPTPAEQLATYPLPKGWQNLPTTDASEAVTVEAVRQKYGAKIAGYFKQWYDAARKKDPAITPSQAAPSFIAGYAVATATGKLASFLTGSSYNVKSGNIDLGGGQEGPGVAQAAAAAAESLYKGKGGPGGSSSACALHIPGFSFGPVGWGGWCIISKTALRGLVGGLLIFSGGAIGLAGLVVVASHAFTGTKTGQNVVKAGTAAFGVAGAPGRALNTRLVSQTDKRERQVKEYDRASAAQAKEVVRYQRQQAAEAKRQEAEERKAAREAPAVGKHAKPKEKGPYQGRHRNPEEG